MNKIKNILIMLMLLTSAGIAEAKLQSEPSGDKLTDYLNSLRLFPNFGREYVIYATDSSGNPLSGAPQFYQGTPAYTRIFADGANAVACSGGTYREATITVGDWGSKTVNLPCNWENNIILVPVTPKQAGQTTITVTQTISGASESITYYIMNGVKVTPATATPTPSVTATPAPKPDPVFIPPAISRLLSIISTWFSGLFGLSIAGGQSVTATVNQPYTTQLSLAFVAPDSNCSDGSCQKKYGEWFIVDSSKNIKSESGWSAALTTSPYTATATFTPLSAGKIYLIGVVVSQQYTYGATGWTMQESIETKEVQEISALVPAATFTAPTTTGAGILVSIGAWLKSMFAWLPW